MAGVGESPLMNSLWGLGAGGAGPLGRSSNGIQLLGVVSLAVGITVFAVGVRGKGSVVGLRPIGLVALIAYGAAPLVIWVATTQGPFPGRTDGSGAYVLWAVQVIAGLIGVIEIARIGAVPGWWRFLPLTLFVVVVALLIIPPMVSFSLAFNPAYDGRPSSLEIMMPTVVLATIAPLILGVTAIVLAAIARGREVKAVSGAVEGPATA